MNLGFQENLCQRGWSNDKINLLYSAFEHLFPAEWNIDFFDSIFIELNWSAQAIEEFTSVIENVVMNNFEESDSLESMSTSPDFVGWTLKDVAIAALYANIDFNVPGFTRPNRSEVVDVVTEAKLKFHDYLEKYRPTGWSHYDMVDISQSLIELFHHEHDENDDDK